MKYSGFLSTLANINLKKTTGIAFDVSKTDDLLKHNGKQISG